MYMPGRRRTGSRPSRTWICSTSYATSAPRGRGLAERPLGGGMPRSGGFMPALGNPTSALVVRADALPAGWDLCDDYWDAGYRNSTRNCAIGIARTRARGPSAGLRRAPAQHGFASRRHLVQAANRQAVWLRAELIGVGASQLNDLPERTHEGVQGRLALGLSRLDHHRFGDDQREIDGRGVEATFEQALGHVHRPDAVRAEVSRRGHELVHARTAVRQLEPALQRLAHVVSRQHGVSGRLGQPVATHSQDVGECAHQHAEVAVEAAHPANGPRAVVVEPETAILTLYRRPGQEWDQIGLNSNWACPRPTSAVWCGERLVEVEVNGIEAHVARAADAHERVQVGAVVVE